MKVLVRIDPSLEAGQTPVEVSAPTLTVREALFGLARSVPSVAGRLFNCDGELRSVFRVRERDRDVSLEQCLHDGETLTIALR